MTCAKISHCLCRSILLLLNLYFGHSRQISHEKDYPLK